MNARTIITVAAFLAVPAVVAAASTHDLRAQTLLAAQADAQMTDGEIRKVDKEAKKITIRHGEIRNLGMPAMTMVFQVENPAMVEQVKPGDKVRFHAEQVNGAMVVTKLESGQ